jgi:hypothetical protein
MSRTVGLPPAATDPFFLRPWVVLLAGLGLAGVGLGLSSLEGHAANVARALFLVAGLGTAAAAVSRRLQTAGQELEQRIETAGMIAVGAFVALVDYLAIVNEVKDGNGKVITAGDDWTSAQFFLIGLIVIALFGAVLVILPSLPRKVLLSLLLVFHFGGIFVAGANVAPGGVGQPPWLTEQLWVRVYRYYLGYVYMTNAYHFYSPDPGPSTLTWFRIQFDDDSYRWVKLPDKQGSLVPLQYTRLMVVADSTKLAGPMPPPWLLQRRINERKEAGRWFTPEPTKDGQKFANVPIPITLEDYFNPFNNLPLPPDAYREPTEYSKRLISSYVRYVANNNPHDKDPSVPIKNIKVYSITHKLIGANEMAMGRDPLQKIYLQPYYMGKFDTSGELLVKQQEYNALGQPTFKEYDGFLYWVVPILPIPEGTQGDFRIPWDVKDYKVRDYMELHAGDIRTFDDSKKGEPKKDEPKKEEGR